MLNSRLVFVEEITTVNLETNWFFWWWHDENGLSKSLVYANIFDNNILFKKLDGIGFQYYLKHIMKNFLMNKLNQIKHG